MSQQKLEDIKITEKEIQENLKNVAEGKPLNISLSLLNGEFKKQYFSKKKTAIKKKCVKCNKDFTAIRRNQIFCSLKCYLLSKRKFIFENRNCKICNKIFLPKHPDTTTCSRKCGKETYRMWREKNKDKINARGKAYREKNKDKIAKIKKAYREKNKDKIAKIKKAYYEKNKDKIRKYEKAYFEKNKDKIKAYFEKNKDKIKAYYEKNKDKINARGKAYYEKNKDKILKQQQKRHAQIRRQLNLE